jgi:hypothetical protein
MMEVDDGDVNVMSDDGESERLDVEYIRGLRRTADGDMEALIKWTDYPKEESSWEPLTNVDECIGLNHLLDVDGESSEVVDTSPCPSWQNYANSCHLDTFLETMYWYGKDLWDSGVQGGKTFLDLIATVMRHRESGRVSSNYVSTLWSLMEKYGFSSLKPGAVQAVSAHWESLRKDVISSHEHLLGMIVLRVTRQKTCAVCGMTTKKILTLPAVISEDVFVEYFKTQTSHISILSLLEEEYKIPFETYCDNVAKGAMQEAGESYGEVSVMVRSSGNSCSLQCLQQYVVDRKDCPELLVVDIEGATESKRSQLKQMKRELRVYDCFFGTFYQLVSVSYGIPGHFYVEYLHPKRLQWYTYNDLYNGGEGVMNAYGFPSFKDLKMISIAVYRKI